MTDLPRYLIEDEPDGCDIREHPEGDWVKWADVSLHLQQLEQEKARLQAALAQAVFEFAMEKGQLEAALAETRDALHQLTEKYEMLLARAGETGVLRDDSVPHSRTE